MKLLIDLGVAHRVAGAVADLFPGSAHVLDVGLARAEDADVWLHARDGAYIIVTKAADFCQRAALFGHPPKVLWLQGDCSTPQLVEGLRNAADRIRSFEADPDQSLLPIRPAGARRR